MAIVEAPIIEFNWELKMAKGFQRGCPLSKELQDKVRRNSGSRPHRGTCRTCEKLGQETQHYREQPCPFMKGTGKYGWKGFASHI